MKILITGTVGESIPPPFGGIPKIALMLAKTWREKGYVVGLTFTYRHESEDDLGAGGVYFSEFNYKPKKIDRILFTIRYFLINPILYLYLLYKYCEFHGALKKEGILYSSYGVFLNRVIFKFKPDILILETALVKSFMASFLAKKHKIPFIIKTYAEVHDVSMTPNKFLIKNQKKMENYWKNFLNMADKVVAPSNYCALGPIKYLEKDKLDMIYGTTLDVEYYETTLKNFSKSEIRKSFGIPNDLFVVLSIGAFTPRKGHDHIIKAIAELKRQGCEDFGVALCGAGDPTEWLDLAVKENISDKLFIFRNLSESDLMKLYKASDVYCDASNTCRACLGMALTEGLASHLPAIAYNAGGLPESVVEGSNGYLVELDNINALAEAIKKMSEIPESERTRFGENSFNRAKEIFDIEVVSTKFLDLINSVVSKNNTID